jgi:hypothetical protein
MQRGSAMGAGSGTRPETPTGPVRSVWPRSSPVKSPEGRQDQGREVPGPESPRRLQLRPPALSGRNLIGHLVPGVFLSEARNVMCCRAWSRQLGLLWVSCHRGAVPQGERIDRVSAGLLAPISLGLDAKPTAPLETTVLLPSSRSSPCLSHGRHHELAAGRPLGERY